MTAATASTTPATAPPAMAAMGTLSADLVETTAAGVDADEAVGVVLASTVVVWKMGGAVTVSTAMLVILGTPEDMAYVGI